MLASVPSIEVRGTSGSAFELSTCHHRETFPCSLFFQQLFLFRLTLPRLPLFPPGFVFLRARVGPLFQRNFSSLFLFSSRSPDLLVAHKYFFHSHSSGGLSKFFLAKSRCLPRKSCPPSFSVSTSWKKSEASTLFLPVLMPVAASRHLDHFFSGN